MRGGLWGWYFTSPAQLALEPPCEQSHAPEHHARPLKHTLLQAHNAHRNGVLVQDVKAPEYVRRPQGLGLGAQPAKPPSQDSRKRRRPGEAAGAKPDLVYIDPQTGLQKNVAPAGAVLTERVRLGVHLGKRMRVAAGRHQGLLCDVLAVDQQVGLPLILTCDSVIEVSPWCGDKMMMMMWC